MATKHKFKTIDIKGKKYVTVNERIKYFRTSEDYTGWSIETSIERLDLGNKEQPDQIMCITVIKDDKSRVMSTGRAWETRDSSFINKTSFIENAETSAVGRALAFLGIGVDESIASEFEVLIAVTGQENKNVDTSGYKPDHTAHERLMETTPKDEIEASLEKIKSNQTAKTEPSTNGSPATVEIPFGKFKGKRVGEVNPVDLANWFNWLTTTNIDRSKNAHWMKAIEVTLGGRNA